jgi:hypothetical protein
MPSTDLLPSLLFKLYENQLALEAAIWSCPIGLPGKVLPTWSDCSSIEGGGNGLSMGHLELVIVATCRL